MMENKRTIFVFEIKAPSMSVKLRLVLSITMVFLSFSGAAQTNYWKISDLSSAEERNVLERFTVDKATAYTLEETTFKKQLIPLVEGKGNAQIVYFPDEKGVAVPFEVREASTFSKELAEKYPEIKSYKGVSTRNDGRRIRFSVSHKGIQSMMSTADRGGAVFMEKGTNNTYVLYHAKDRSAKDMFVCKTVAQIPELDNLSVSRPVNDQVLRKYRLAVAASGEYTNYHGGTKIDALAAINATVTRINEILENDLAVTLELIGTTDNVIYTDAATDPFTGGLSSQTQNTLDTVIGDANYDIGHLFNQQNNALDGNAGFVGAVCRSGRKGSAYSTFSRPEGDAFAIDLVAHEMGHQLGANHTFSHISEGTPVQVEPGSGTTIMGYAGITQENDVAEMSDDYFHYVSIVQINDYLQTVSCGEVINLVNTPPNLTTTPNYTIPKGTAFVLEGIASDADTTDVLTYAWEQTDAAIVTQATFGPTNPVGALFRSLPPTTVSSRYFPKLERILAGNLTETSPDVNDAWETVSLVERELNFALTVRDNSLEGGQLASDELSIFVSNDAGPFMVTSQDTAIAYDAGEVQTVTWDVANTNVAPVSATTVDIFLSTDGGQSFPITIAENVINDGSHEFVVPAIPTTNARLMVKASNSIFLAVNTVGFSIIESQVVLQLSQLNYEVCQPDSVTVDFIYETYLGFNEESLFSVAGLPAGLSAAFSVPTAIDNGTPVTVTFSGSENVVLGTYPVQIIATAPNLVKEVGINISVYDTNFDDLAPIFPLNLATDVSKDLTLEWDANARNTGYDIEIATDVAFTDIVETATTTNTFYAPNNLVNNVSYFWRVRPKNTCGDGVFGPPLQFTTILINCDSESAFNLPIEISSIATPTITSKIVFYEDLPIADINVNLNVEHTFLSDLQISLTSPAGTTVILVSNSCDDSRNINAVFDDAAAPFFCGGNPAIGGIVAPLGSLSSFNGESILGEWILEIKDNVADDGGRLNSFSLDVCIEGDFRPDADNDGVFDDGEDVCLGTPDGQEVDASGCAIYRFVNQNFDISLESETCRANNDGTLTITPKVGLSYEITILGPGTNITQGFTNVFTLSDLRAGVYDLCITGTDGTIVYEPFCSQVVITEPDVLDVSAKVSLDGAKLTVNLLGADFYNLELNGTVVQTQESEVILDLKNGINELKVFTDIPCQGTYTQQFVRSDVPLVYPNPFEDSIQVYFGNAGSTISLKIFTADGRLVKSVTTEVDANGTQIDLKSLSTGFYFVQFSGNGVTGTAKIIKK